MNEHDYEMLGDCVLDSFRYAAGEWLDVAMEILKREADGALRFSSPEEVASVVIKRWPSQLEETWLAYVWHKSTSYVKHAHGSDRVVCDLSVETQDDPEIEGAKCFVVSFEVDSNTPPDSIDVDGELWIGDRTYEDAKKPVDEIEITVPESMIRDITIGVAEDALEA